MVLLIDNYDSFSYNVYQFIGALARDVKVVRNDRITLEEIQELSPTHIILSPGPGRPADAGICEDVIRTFAGKVPILGICLGHQAICEVFGATITYAKTLMHGKQSIAALDNGSILFAGMNHQTTVGRYHSLAADPETLPACLKVVAQTDDGEIMAVEHREYPVYGVQFHPESVLTPEGMTILENFLTGGKAAVKRRESKKMAIYEAIKKLTAGEDIGYQMSKDVMNEIMNGEATDVAKASYLTALSMKGETGEEISGSAEAMRDHAVRMNVSGDTLEIVGTGGDCYGSFNISTTSSIVIAAAGVPVTKHGNRAASSKSGAADCLEALGVNIQIDPKKNEEVFRKANICFLFAQKYHMAMRYVGPIRKELGVRTVFNLLGPLTNPAFATLQILGVYSEDLVEPMAKVLTDIGVRRGMVVYGMEKIDEISSCGPTKVCEFEGDSFKTYEITPEEFGLTRGERGQLVGGTPEDNAKITLSILQGEQGPRRDAVLMNAGAGLYIAGKAQTMAEGVKLAADLIDSGKAYEKLQQFIRETNAE